MHCWHLLIQLVMCTTDTDGFQLTESSVVVDYLAEKYKDQGTQLIPDSAASVAKV